MSVRRSTRITTGGAENAVCSLVRKPGVKIKNGHAVFVVEVNGVKYLFNTNDGQDWFKLKKGVDANYRYFNQKTKLPKDGFDTSTYASYVRPLMNRDRNLYDRHGEGACAAAANAMSTIFSKMNGSNDSEKLNNFIRYMINPQLATVQDLIRHARVL